MCQQIFVERKAETYPMIIGYALPKGYIIVTTDTWILNQYLRNGLSVAAMCHKGRWYISNAE
jgi:hypothetical protein